MAVTTKMYGNFLKTALNKEVDVDTDSIKVMLCTALTIDQDASVYLVDLTKTEVVAGGGYTTGGQALTTVAVTYDGATNVVKIDADDVIWAASTITAAFAVVYDDTPATNKPLLSYIDFGESLSSSAGDFKIQWDAAGIATITVS